MKKILWMLPLALLIAADNADAREKRRGKRQKTEEVTEVNKKEKTAPESKNKELNAAIKAVIEKNPAEFKELFLSLAAKLILNDAEAKAELAAPAAPAPATA
ncbi:MAG: hypothetical protein BGO07_00910 [Alphaproteobacteria bacterium 40-19]|nr:MAG: hypothetical protein BGO07_00910 [Alphaproteobacteria bacterium 40-19]